MLKLNTDSVWSNPAGSGLILSMLQRTGVHTGVACGTDLAEMWISEASRMRLNRTCCGAAVVGWRRRRRRQQSQVGIEPDVAGGPAAACGLVARGAGRPGRHRRRLRRRRR